MRLLVFGLGYTAIRLATRLRRDGWAVTGTGQSARPGVMALEDPTVAGEIAQATHILSSVPPGAAGDPVLTRYGRLIAARARWIGYLSSTGVYGDTGGAWVDETAPIGTGRRSARSDADLAWQALPDAHIFRLPGIYGPGRSAIDRVRSGAAQRVDAPGHIFSRIHVDDIVEAVVAAIRQPKPGVYNIADNEPASGAAVIEAACDLMGVPYPPIFRPEQLGPQARGFYSERRRVANGKMKRDLGVRLRYPDHAKGLRACLEEVP